MKYYIAKIEERNGEFEYDTKYLFAIDGDPTEYTKEMASSWRGGGSRQQEIDGSWDEALGGWWCYDTLVFDKGHQEISKEDFDVLSKYLSDI
jgi:hypothetical protein